MMPDHYATLGVDPSANAAAIRTAYLALMRENHPDRNPSAEATLRAQAIIAAFTVLGDFDRRNHYDWDRRREREAAAALAAKRPRAVRPGAVAAGAIGLAVIGALASIPAATPKPEPIAQPVTVVKPAPEPRLVAKARPALEPRRMAVARPVDKSIARPVPVAPRAEAVRAARVEPEPRKPKMERAPVVRVAAVKAPLPRLLAPPAPPPPPRQSKAEAKPVRQTAKPVTDLASLDQFVMNFYGQSWRYGDAPKRAALVQSRDKFVVSRGACVADECKRAAYLRLMRDVSEIVETGQPKPR